MILEDDREIKGVSMRLATTLLGVLALHLLLCMLATAEEKPALKVGVILSLSGGLEQWCDHMRRGFELAASEEDALKVSLIFEDDHSIDKKATVTVTKKLTHIDKSDVIVLWTLSELQVIAPITSKAHIPLVVGAYDSRIQQAGPYVYGGLVNYTIIPREIAQFFKRKGVHRVGLVTATDDWSDSFEKPFCDEVRQLGLELVYSENIIPSETETRPIIASMKKHKVEAVLAPLFGNSLISFIRRHREMNDRSLINVGDGMFESDIKTLGESAEGVTAMQVWLESSELRKKISNRFGVDSDPLQLGLVASGYDLMRHIILAAKDVTKRRLPLSGETINEALQHFTSVGYLGEHMLGAAPARSGETAVVVTKGRYALNP